MKYTQCELIIKYIDEFGSITRWEAMRELGIANFGARQTDLKKKHNIKLVGKWEAGYSRYGTPVKWKRYTYEN